jgi:pilus assembly protein CpaE
VDLDLEFGSVASAFDCTPTYTLANLCNGDEVDSHMIRAALAELPNNVSLLARPTDLEQVYDVSPARLREVLDTLAEMFPYVVIDMSRLNGEVGRVALEHAHRVIIVTQSNVFSVRNASRVLETLHRAGVDPERVEAVINRAQSNGKRKKGKELASYVSCPVHTRVPNEYSRVQTSLDRGIIADMEKDSAVRLAIMEIAGRIAGISLEDRHPRRGLLRKLLGLNKPRR